ncbi:hypothetical protein B7P43_G05845, partial [Cryptotermes secundus]
KRRVSSSLRTFHLFHFCNTKLKSRDSSVGMATGYQLDDLGVGVPSPGGGKNFLFRQGREADHSPPTSAEVKKMWMYISTPPYAFMA